MTTLEQILRKKTKQLERDIQIASEPTAQVMKNKLKQKIEDDVYSTPPSDSYNRSRGLINATTHLVTKVASSMQIRVFIEPTLMGFVPFEEHSSWVTGGDERVNVPFYVNYGHGGVVSSAPTLFLEHTIEELRQGKSHVQEMRRQLISLGYTIK